MRFSEEFSLRDGLRVATVSFMAEAVIAFSNGEQQLSARQMLKFSTQKKNTLSNFLGVFDRKESVMIPDFVFTHASTLTLIFLHLKLVDKSQFCMYFCHCPRFFHLSL